jgi:CheY-like chemotaxis protein
MKNVLLVEKDGRTAQAIQKLLVPLGFSFTWCKVLSSATKAYSSNRDDLQLILLDDHFLDSRFVTDCDGTTFPFIDQITKDKNFKGKLVGMYSSPELKKIMNKAGLKLVCRKRDIVEYVADLFKTKENT